MEYGCTKCILFIDNHIADAVANSMAAAEKITAGVFIDLQNQLMTINPQDGARSFDCYEATPATR